MYEQHRESSDKDSKSPAQVHRKVRSKSPPKTSGDQANSKPKSPTNSNTHNQPHKTKSDKQGEAIVRKTIQLWKCDYLFSIQYVETSNEVEKYPVYKFLSE